MSLKKSEILNIHKYFLKRNNIKTSSLNEQVLVLLFAFSQSLSHDRIKCLSLNDEPCMVRLSLVYSNLLEHRYFPFMISLDRCSGSGNVLSPKEKQQINAEAFKMITNKKQAKAMKNNICCECK